MGLFGNVRYSRISLSFSLLFLSGLLFGCSERSGSDNSDQETIIIQTFGDERIFFQDYWGMEASFLLFLPLVQLDVESGEHEGVLAQTWEHSEDFTNWTFHLRDDIYWQDSVQFTARDIMFTHKVRIHDEVESGIEPFIRFEATDDFTIVAMVREPVDISAFNWSVFYPKHLLEEMPVEAFRNWDFWKAPVGNGPYRFVRAQGQNMVEIEANPLYHGEAPEIKKAILKFSEGISEILGGSVDIATYTSPDIRLKMNEDSPYKLYNNWEYHFLAVYWNHANPMFESPAIRRALTLAIDRKTLAQLLNYPPAVPVTDGYTSPAMQSRKQYPEAIPFNLEASSKILAQQGWADTDNDGILDKGGVPFSFEMKVPGEAEKEAVFIKDQLRKIGVEVRTTTLDNQLARRTFFGTKDFEAIIMPSFHRLTQPNFGILRLLGPNSQFNNQSKELYEIASEINQSRPDLRNPLYDHLNDRFKEEMPYTFLLPRVTTHVVRKNIKGLKDGVKSNPIMYLPELSIEN